MHMPRPRSSTNPTSQRQALRSAWAPAAAVVLAAGIAPSAALAQQLMEPVRQPDRPLNEQAPQPPAASDPERALDDASADNGVQQARPLEKPDVDPRIMPTPRQRVSPVIPGFEALDIPRPGGKSAAEGSFLVRRLGVMHLIETGDLIFAPAVESAGESAPVFLITPSEQSDRLKAQIDASFRWTGRVSGEVFTYKGRSHLLIAAFAPEPLSAPAQIARPQAAAPQADPDDGPEPQAAEPSGVLDARVTELAEELLRESSAPRALDPAMQAPGIDAVEPAINDYTSGMQIIRRRARLVRDVSGRWQVRFDQDGDKREPPLTVVPCQLLEVMERQAMNRGDSWTFHISGRVITSESGLFIVPTLFISERDDDLAPRQ